MALLEQLNKLTAQNIFLDENTGGKGRYFKSRFLQAGLVKYSFGVCILSKETIDKFVDGFVGCPVIINHKDVTNESAKDDRVGVISRVWYDEKDGWFWCEGVIFDEEAISLIESGYNVSCQYEITEYSNNTTKALHNGNPYDKVILNGKPEHLAIVKTPRYESAMIAVNALDLTAENEDKWITIKPNGEDGKGRHLLLKDGETPKEAIDRTYKKKNKNEQTEVKEHSKEWHEQRYNNRINALKLMSTQIKESPDYNAEYVKDTIQKLLKSNQFSGYKYDINKDDFIKEGHGDALAYIGQIYGKENGDRKKKQDAGFKLLQEIVRQDLSNQEKEWLGIKSDTKDGGESILDTIERRNQQAKELKEKGVLKDIKKPKTFEERQQEDIDKGELVELGKFPTKFTSEYEDYKPKDKQPDTKDGKDLYSDENFKENAKRLNEQFGEKPYSEWQKDVQTLLKKYGKTEEDFDNAIGAKKDAFKQESKTEYKIPDDYKKSVEHYSKEKHEQAADFYGEKMATVQKKSVAHPENEDYRKQFEEYKALKDYHEDKAKSDSKGEKKYTWDDKEYTADELMEKGFKPMKYSGSIYKDDHLTYLEKNDGKKLYRVKIPEDEYKELENKRREKNRPIGMSDVSNLLSDKDKFKKFADDLYSETDDYENGVFHKANVSGELRKALYHTIKTNSPLTQSEWEEKLYRHLKKINKANNSKENEMALIEELKKLILKVENTKGEKDMKIENEKVDKRDIIRQIMAIAGKEEASEDVKTIAKLAEKLAYDKSEAGTADNKGKNEDDEEEVEEVKEDVKEDVENKCKNSIDNSKVDYFSKLNEIYNSASQIKEETEYVSQADREKAAEDYFAK